MSDGWFHLLIPYNLTHPLLRLETGVQRNEMTVKGPTDKT